jgi:hypothetical protein
VSEKKRIPKTPGGHPSLWNSLVQLAAEGGDGERFEPLLMLLRLHDPGLCDVDWEGLARQTGEGGGAGPLTVLRTEVGPGNFQPGEPLSFRDLPVRVLVVGADADAERGSDPPWHEDLAVHEAVHAHAGGWEVDVLPEPVEHRALADALQYGKPHVLHLTGSAVGHLLEQGPNALGKLNLSSVRLVVSTSDAPPDEAHRLLQPYVQADALHPVLAAVSLTSPPAPEGHLCTSLTGFYGALADGRGIEEAVRSVTAPVLAAATVNCLPELVLPQPAGGPPHSDENRDPSDPLTRATDRVGQRRTALEQLESGAELKQLIVLSGGEPGDPIGATWFLLSMLRVWEKRPGCRALYLDFGQVGRSRPLRSAGAAPQPPQPVLDTVELLERTVRANSDRFGGWNVDGDLGTLKELVERERRHDGVRMQTSPVREELVKTAARLVVNSAPPGTHLVLALDHFAETDQERDEAPGLVRDLFNAVLLSPSAISVVVAARNPRETATVQWLREFVVEQRHITLRRWPARHAGPLLRELGIRMEYDWHKTLEWRDLVREKLQTVGTDFGPKFLEEVYDAALTRIG